MKYKSKIVILFLVAFTASISNAYDAFQCPIPEGTIKSVFIKYKDSDEITITPGYGENAGVYWEITTDTDVLLSPTTAAEIVYIYIDDSASSYPTPTIIGTTTAPVWSDSRQGYYNGFDRCIGGVYSESGSATIKSFKNIFTKIIFDDHITIDSGVNPDSTDQSTSTDIDTIAPNMTHQLYVTVIGMDIGDHVLAYARSVAVPKRVIGNWGYSRIETTGWIDVLPEDRSLYIGGENNDENLLGLNFIGYDISR